MKKLLGSTLFLAICICFARVSIAAPISLSASDDNYVYTGETNNNYDSESVKILVKNATSNDRIGYIKFDLSAVIGSVDTSQAATLNLTFSDVSNAGTGDTAEFIIAALANTGTPGNINWQEGTVTYNTRPTGTFDDLSPSYNWSYNDTNVAHSVTLANLDDYLQTDNTVTFRIFGPQLPDTGNNPYWHSSEATNAAYRPSLVVVPEASTLGLMALGMIAVLGISRRRKVVA